MIEQFLIKLGCSFVAILITTLFFFIFGVGGLAFIAGGSLTLALTLLCEKPR